MNSTTLRQQNESSVGSGGNNGRLIIKKSAVSPSNGAEQQLNLSQAPLPTNAPQHSSFQNQLNASLSQVGAGGNYRNSQGVGSTSNYRTAQGNSKLANKAATYGKAHPGHAAPGAPPSNLPTSSRSNRPGGHLGGSVVATSSTGINQVKPNGSRGSRGGSNHVQKVPTPKNGNNLNVSQ